ncbi:fatty acyl-AMP ligase [Corallococcus sp. M34]|uniref:fatty acyl-AMP ligase n=1 Tax=Citreicoccus inhibens TaxID=2849499 RepID=UPI001C228BEC|nr:fatty acyl-AMP ligase [Citreicoccus inhibens]MBU8897137.1 fatty acyl-AMP ligase [Citreicoccus inhibens]
MHAQEWPSHRTLAEAIARVGVLHPENGFTFQDLEGHETFVAFPDLDRRTALLAAGLQRLGLERGDRLGLLIILPEDFILTFLAALRLGVIPVPVYPPMYLNNLEDYARTTTTILKAAGARFLVASDELLGALETFLDWLPELKGRVLGCHALNGAESPPRFPDIQPDDVAFLQYTSGSTSAPKGVVVTHRALLGNIRGFMGHGLRMVPGVDKGVSWLPLYHDMGLVGFVLGPVVWGVSVVFIPTLRFVRNASVWLDTIHRHRGTVSFGPNFAYALALRKSKPAQMAQWDLSCMKAFGCGAEPIAPGTLRQFARVLGEHSRLSPRALLPAYGLAESTLAVTMKPLDEELRTRRVDSAFQQTGQARLAEPDAPALEHVSCGVPFPEHEVVILDREGQPLPDGQEGAIHVRGPSVMAGYFQNEEQSREALKAGWLNTGDLGYFCDGHLYVTGRTKDLIILNGRNLHPQVIEWAVSEVEGVRRGNVVAFSRPGDEGEELVVVAETSSSDRVGLSAQIEYVVRLSQNVRRAEVVCIGPGGLPKTSSGKVKRHQVRELYLRNQLQ